MSTCRFESTFVHGRYLNKFTGEASAERPLFRVVGGWSHFEPAGVTRAQSIAETLPQLVGERPPLQAAL